MNIDDALSKVIENSATATRNQNTSEKKKTQTGSEEASIDEDPDSKKTADTPAEGTPAADTEQDDDSNKDDRAVEKNYTQDLLKRLTEMDATDGDFRNIILNLIQIACNITLEEKKDVLTEILSNKIKSYIQTVYANLNYSTYDVFGYLIFYSFLFDDKENRNTKFGDFVDGKIVELKNQRNLNIENVKNIFQTNILENNDLKKTNTGK
jgi:hypothetical protein